jgi:hypothetical protein
VVLAHGISVYSIRAKGLREQVSGLFHFACFLVEVEILIPSSRLSNQIDRGSHRLIASARLSSPLTSLFSPVLNSPAIITQSGLLLLCFASTQEVGSGT